MIGKDSLSISGGGGGGKFDGVVFVTGNFSYTMFGGGGVVFCSGCFSGRVWLGGGTFAGTGSGFF